MDLTSLGVKVGYAIETVAGTAPVEADYVRLPRCSAIGGISIDPEQIDVSALEDYITRYNEGRADTGGSWELTFNVNDDVLTTLETFYSDSATGYDSDKATWVEVVIPGLTDGFFVKVKTPTKVAMPDISENSKLEVSAMLTISQYVGLDTKIDLPADAGDDV